MRRKNNNHIALREFKMYNKPVQYKIPMTIAPVTTYSKARTHLKYYFDLACSDFTPIVVKRSRGGNVVIIPESYYNSWAETEYLKRVPANEIAILKARENKKGRKTFKSLNQLKDELGI